MEDGIIRVDSVVKKFKITIQQSNFFSSIHSFFHPKYRIVHAVDDVSFKIKQGEIVGFLGPNGAGKTTILKILSGLLFPTSGDVRVLGYCPWQRKDDFLRNFAMVIGNRTQLWWDLPVEETFLLNKKIFSIAKSDYKHRLDELIELLDLKDLLIIPSKKLSLGQRMRAEFACSLLHAPHVLLLDEPTLGLDIEMQKRLRLFILRYRKLHNATILLTSHNMKDVETLCKRLILIDHGKIVYDGNISHLIQKHVVEKVITLSVQQLDIDMVKKKLYPCCKILSYTTDKIKITVSRDQMMETLPSLLSIPQVKDVMIDDFDIEMILDRIFHTPV